MNGLHLLAQGESDHWTWLCCYDGEPNVENGWGFRPVFGILTKYRVLKREGVRVRMVDGYWEICHCPPCIRLMTMLSEFFNKKRREDEDWRFYGQRLMWWQKVGVPSGTSSL